jgi:hypothetical protein
MAEVHKLSDSKQNIKIGLRIQNAFAFIYCNGFSNFLDYGMKHLFLEPTAGCILPLCYWRQLISAVGCSNFSVCLFNFYIANA